MNVVRSLDDIRLDRPGVVMAIGFFDGVHLGHQRVIELSRRHAEQLDVEAWVMTFDPHPLTVVQPAAAPFLLTTLPAKLSLLSRQGVAGCIVMPFTRQFSELSPDDFLRRLVERIPGLKAVVIGENWRFGRQARGDVARLKQLAGEFGFAVAVADPVSWNGQTISSSRIRETIAAGSLADAAAMLGRPYSIRGVVEHGTKRGRRLGFPTANLNLPDMALPPPGIYAVRVEWRGGLREGAVYRPAHANNTPGLIEVHLIDYEGDLYGQELTVEFQGKIRDDTLRFPDESSLTRQIQNDIEAIRQVLQKKP